MEFDGSMKMIRILKDSSLENRLYRDSDQIEMPTDTEERKQNYLILMCPIIYRIKMEQLKIYSLLRLEVKEMELRVSAALSTDHS